jgi:DASS family divalent anion:Na+ symporter
MSGEPEEFNGARVKPLIGSIILGLIIWFMPHPEGVTDQAWHLLAIFLATIVGVISRPLPVGPVVLIGMVVAVLTKTMTSAQAFSAFAKPAIWLIVIAFFLSRGLIKTGLASRVSYLFLKVLGKSTIGLAYGLLFGELALAPFIPSLSARSGGIVYPLILGLNADFDPKYVQLRKFLVVTAFQGSVICSAIFLTSMAANPLAASAAAEFGITVSWTQWALAGIVPGVLSLLALPRVVAWIFRPEVVDTPGAPKMAAAQLEKMGPLKKEEKAMLGTFGIVLSMWLGGPYLGIDATTSAMVGLCLLLIFGILEWKDCTGLSQAWDALFWLCGLIAMGSALKEQGFFVWLSEAMTMAVGGMPWYTAFVLLVLVYFYSHYFFASNTAHVTAMYAAFLGTALQVGTPPLLAMLVLAFSSSLFGGLTHYSSGPAPIFYGARFVPLGEWWRAGAIVSVVNILIWGVAGGLWWKVLGLW